jgi:SAM-dependent methyltransferase
MLQAAAAMSTSSYLQADAAQLPFRPATFDALLCVAAIPYLPDFAKAVTEWRRVAQPGANLVFTTPAADGIETLRLIRQAAADHGLALADPHARLGTADHIADTLDSLGLLLRQVEERTYPDTLDADPRTAYDRVLEYGFLDQLRTAPPATSDAVYESFQSAYRELQTAGNAQHVTIFTLCSFSR